MTSGVAKREILDGNRIASKGPVEHRFENFARFGPDRHTGLTTRGFIDQLNRKLFGQFAGSILHVTHGVVNVALSLVELTFGLKLLVTSDFTDGLFNAALGLVGGAFHVFSVHCVSPTTNLVPANAWPS